MNASDPILIDRFGRNHDYLRISLTERCNLRCFYCMPEEGIQLRDKKEFMSTEELLFIVKTFVDLGVKKVRLTGGEPLIRKDISIILKELAKFPIELAITTNGVLIDKYIDDLKQAGVKKINVSLDSLKEEKFNAISRRSYFTKIKENITLLLAENFEVKINMVVIKDTNEDEINDFVEWTKFEKINVRFIEFMPFDGNKWDKSKQVTLDEIIQNIKNHFGENNVTRLLDSKNDTCKNYKIENSKGSFGIISSISNPFCDSCNRIRLTADGKLKNCLFSSSESNLLDTLRNGEEILPIILQSIQSKEKERGGVFSKDNAIMEKYKNRSMISIGG